MGNRFLNLKKIKRYLELAAWFAVAVGEDSAVNRSTWSVVEFWGIN